MKEFDKRNQFRQPLFDFYMNRSYSPVEKLQGINRILGTTAIGLSMIAWGSIGVGVAVIAGTAAVINERRFSKILDKVASEYQSLIQTVYKSQE